MTSETVPVLGNQLRNANPYNRQLWIPWQNTHSTTCPAGGLVQLNGILDGTGDDTQLSGTQPNGVSSLIAINGNQQVLANGWGLLTFAFGCPAYIRTQSGLSALSIGDGVGAKSGQWEAIESVSLFRVAGPLVDNRVAVLSLPSVPVFRGKTDASIAKAASGTVSRWSGTSSAGLTDTGENDTVYNAYGNVGSGKWVGYVAYPWGFEMIAAEC